MTELDILLEPLRVSLRQVGELAPRLLLALVALLLILLAGFVFAAALSFGLGGRDWAAQLLERWWPRRR